MSRSQQQAGSSSSGVLFLLVVVVVIVWLVHEGPSGGRSSSTPPPSANSGTGRPRAAIDSLRDNPGDSGLWLRVADEWQSNKTAEEAAIAGARAISALLVAETTAVNDEAILSALDIIGPLPPSFYLDAAERALDKARGSLASRLLELTARKIQGSGEVRARFNALGARAEAMTSDSGSSSGDGSGSSPGAGGESSDVGMIPGSSATLQLRSTYPLRISIDGTTSGEGKTIRQAISPGHHDILIAAPDVYLDESRQSIEVPVGALVDLSSRLPRVSQLFLSAPGQCRISIDGRDVEWAPVTVAIVAGQHEVVFDWRALSKRSVEPVTIREITERLFAPIPR